MNGWEIKSTILLPILPENRKTFLKRVLSHSETKLICDQSRELEVSLGHLPLQHKKQRLNFDGNYQISAHHKNSNENNDSWLIQDGRFLQ